MAQIIQFPSGTPAPAAPLPLPAATKSRTPKQASRGKVVPIKRGVRALKANRAEDDGTIMVAKIAQISATNAYNLAQSEPNSERHRLAAHMAGISEKLPCNNLRVYTTADDIVEGLWRAWRRVCLASLEWQLADMRRMDAAQRGDESAKIYWTEAEAKAEAHAWHEYERLVRVPADSLKDFKTYKLSNRLERGLGSLAWIRKWKPELADMLDDEQARLIAKKEARSAARAAKKREAGA